MHAVNDEVLEMVRDDKAKRNIVKRRQDEKKTLEKRVNAVKRIFKSVEKQMAKEGIELNFQLRVSMNFMHSISKSRSTKYTYHIKVVSQGIKEHLMCADIVAKMQDGQKDSLELAVNIGPINENNIKVLFNKNGTVKAKISEEIKRKVIKEVAELNKARDIGLLSWQSKYQSKLLP